MKSHFILYVSDQKAATKFYSSVLALTPTLDVPGMTEFAISDGCTLGLMPERGIKRLLDESIPDPAQANGIPRAEIYLRVTRPEVYHQRALQCGARELSAVDRQDWGDLAGYSIDSDGHVIAFAKAVPKQTVPFKLVINDAFLISDITLTDKPAYIEHLKEKQIYDQTLNIPYPYSDKDADEWIGIVADETEKLGRSVNWAIRQSDGNLVGGIGFHGLDSKNSYRAEIGYWLTKPHWNQGIMTSAVRKVTEFAFKELGLIRITAHVFDFNIGSARVLEKAEYQLEGNLRKHYRKDGKVFDGKLFAKVSEHSSSMVVP